MLSKYGWSGDLGGKYFKSHLTSVSTTSTSTSVSFNVNNVITKYYCENGAIHENGYFPYSKSGKVKAGGTKTVGFQYLSGESTNFACK